MVFYLGIVKNGISRFLILLVVQAFTNIETKVPCTLNDHPDFPIRDHKTSDHQRVVPSGKSYPVNFRCHHLLFKIIATGANATDTNNISSIE